MAERDTRAKRGWFRRGIGPASEAPVQEQGQGSFDDPWSADAWSDEGWDDEWQDRTRRASVRPAADPRSSDVDAWLESDQSEFADVTADMARKWKATVPEAEPGSTWDVDDSLEDAVDEAVHDSVSDASSTLDPVLVDPVSVDPVLGEVEGLAADGEGASSALDAFRAFEPPEVAPTAESHGAEAVADAGLQSWIERHADVVAQPAATEASYLPTTQPDGTSWATLDSAGADGTDLNAHDAELGDGSSLAIDESPVTVPSFDAFPDNEAEAAEGAAADSDREPVEVDEVGEVGDADSEFDDGLLDEINDEFLDDETESELLDADLSDGDRLETDPLDLPDLGHLEPAETPVDQSRIAVDATAEPTAADGEPFAAFTGEAAEEPSGDDRPAFPPDLTTTEEPTDAVPSASAATYVPPPGSTWDDEDTDTDSYDEFEEPEADDIGPAPAADEAVAPVESLTDSLQREPFDVSPAPADPASAPVHLGGAVAVQAGDAAQTGDVQGGEAALDDELDDGSSDPEVDLEPVIAGDTRMDPEADVDRLLDDDDFVAFSADDLRYADDVDRSIEAELFAEFGDDDLDDDLHDADLSGFVEPERERRAVTASLPPVPESPVELATAVAHAPAPIQTPPVQAQPVASPPAPEPKPTLRAKPVAESAPEPAPAARPSHRDATPLPATRLFLAIGLAFAASAVVHLTLATSSVLVDTRGQNLLDRLGQAAVRLGATQGLLCLAAVMAAVLAAALGRKRSAAEERQAGWISGTAMAAGAISFLLALFGLQYVLLNDTVTDTLGAAGNLLGLLCTAPIAVWAGWRASS